MTLALSCAVAACSAPRNTLGTSASSCFRALPPARAAVHHTGRLVGVRRVGAATAARHFPEAAVASGGHLCLVALEGAFNAADITGARGAKTGRYAIVAVDPHHDRVVGVHVVDRLPLRFRHSV
jgi:hypothetical protein